MNAIEGKQLRPKERQERARIMLTCLLGAVLVYMSFYMTYHLLHDLPGSDLSDHLEWAKELTVKDAAVQLLTGENRLWHICVKTLIRYGGFRDIYAACAVTAGSSALTYGVLCCLFGRTLEVTDRRMVPVATLALCLVGPIYLPWYNEQIYMGQGSPNVWHSPTQLMVRPFALITFWMTICIYQRLREGGWPAKVFRGWGEAAAFAGILVLGVWAKPCYFQGAVPALGLLMIIDLIRSRGKAFPFCLKLAAAHIPAALLTVLRFYTAFYADEAGEGVEFAFLDVWRHNSKSVLVSILLLCAFPLFVAVVDRKRFFSRLDGQFALAVMAANGLYKACLAENGVRRYHGNFSWGWNLAVMLVWTVALKEFVHLMNSRELSEREYKVAAYGGWTLLALHLLTGIVYFCLIAAGTKQC